MLTYIYIWTSIDVCVCQQFEIIRSVLFLFVLFFRVLICPKKICNKSVQPKILVCACVCV